MAGHQIKFKVKSYLDTLGHQLLSYLLVDLVPIDIILLWCIGFYDVTILSILAEENLLEILLHLQAFLAFKVSIMVRYVNEWVLNVRFLPYLSLKKRF